MHCVVRSVPARSFSRSSCAKPTVQRTAVSSACRHRCRVRVYASEGIATVVPPPAPAIAITDKALDHLKKLRAENKDSNLLLRVGVKQGGCSGLSYNMDFEKRENISSDDMVLSYDNGSFEIAIDPKSLLYLFGMRLDFSDALIGGGFQFHNPNAAESCGCGKSFGV